MKTIGRKKVFANIPALLTVKLKRKGQLLAAVPSENATRLSSNAVDRTRKRPHKRAHVST
jgi:hypothetical protein